VAQRLVVGPAVADQRLAEGGARVEIVPVLGDRLAQLADRLVEVTATAPRDAEPRYASARIARSPPASTTARPRDAIATS